MGSYFHGNSEIQGDGLQTLIFMNPAAYTLGYSDTPQHQHHHQPPPSSNFVFLNSSTATATTHFSHAPPSHSTQHLVGIPLSARASAALPLQQDHHSQQQQDISALHGFVSRLQPQYSLYDPVDHTAARVATPSHHQGLSLSLSSQQPIYGSFKIENAIPSPAAPAPPATISPRSSDDVRPVPGGSPSASRVTNVQSMLLSSKYLKAAQEILEEVVGVGNRAKNSELAKAREGKKDQNIKGRSPAASTRDGSSGQTSAKQSSELTTAERQEIQMKKAKLVNMLDEVEKRYRQYHGHMQIVISWFEQAAGIGSPKTYTALALQTISKQFRCLKDAITGQIRTANKSLGEEDSQGGGKVEGSRLKYVDNQLRQQRTLQQLGMIQHNAWRPQRGLPERSVSVLRAWLFENFLHPYPKDSDKHMLAKQTGLTRSQVSNWFINARVRLWKPMVEEMYTEEIKEHEQNGSEDKTRNGELNEELASKAGATQEKSPSTENQDTPRSQNSHPTASVSTLLTSTTGLNVRDRSGFTLIGSSEMEEMKGGSPKRQRSTNMLQFSDNGSLVNMDSKPEPNMEQVCMKFHNEQRQNRDGFALMGSPTNYIRGFDYPIGEVGKFGTDQFTAPYPGNGVSLTLALPHGENLSMSETHQNFLPNQNIQLGRGVEISEANEFGAIDTPTSSHSANVYANMNIQSRKRFAAQLLPDFVA